MDTRDSRNHATRRKAENAKAIRDRLSQYGHHEQAIVILEKLQDETIPLDNQMITRMSKALDGHIRMISHYLPKIAEISTPDDKTISINIVKPDGAD